MSTPSLRIAFTALLAVAGCASPVGGGDAGVDVPTRDAPARPDGTSSDVAAMDTLSPPEDTPVPPADTPPPPPPVDVPVLDAPLDGPPVTDPPPDVPLVDGSGSCAAGCPRGFTCGPRGYCVSPTGVPAFGHVYIIMMENHSLSSITSSSSAGFINMLISRNATATAYTGVTHPSLPNYIALASGSTNGVGCDCAPTGTTGCNAFVCNRVLGACSCPVNAMHLGDVFDTASIPWRSYGEGMGMPCNTSDNGSTHYAARHLPFLYFDNVRTNAARCAQRVRDYRDFATDLAAGTYRFSMISPNLCNDMHDTCGGDSIANGNTWLSTNVPPILATPGFGAGGTDVLFIVWDEDDGILSSGPVPFIAISPLARSGTMTTMGYNHYSLVATIADGLGVPRIAMSTTARPIADIWR